jgi:ankyrin repeat protein
MSIKVIFTDYECMYDEKIKVYFDLVREVLDELKFTEILLNSFDITKQRFDNLVGICDRMVKQNVYIPIHDFELFDYLNCVFKYKNTHNLMSDINADWCEYFSSIGDLDHLKYVVENGCSVNSCSFLATSMNGNLECFKYLFGKLPNRLGLCSDKFDHNLCYYASKNGHLDFLKYLLEEKNLPCGTNEFACAIINGQLECLKYLYKSGYVTRTELYQKNFCNDAICYGQLECLKYLIGIGSPINKQSCKFAAQRGLIDIIKYLHEKGCHWDETSCLGAAQNGQLECLKYLHETGCPWDEETLYSAIENGHLECVEYLCQNGCPIETIEGKWKDYYWNMRYVKNFRKTTICCNYADEFFEKKNIL